MAIATTWAPSARPGADGSITAEVLSTPDEIALLSKAVRHLPWNQEYNWDPLFYLASIEEGLWIPRIVSVKNRDELVGVLFAKELQRFGFPLGIIYADATMGGMLISKENLRAKVLEAAIQKIWALRSVRALRMLVCPGSLEDAVVRGMCPPQSFDIFQEDLRNHAVLNLSATYELFLERLGKQTRRNFRYYRRRSEAAGQKYVEEMTLEGFRASAFQMLEKNVVGGDRSGLDRALGMLAHAKLPVLVGIRRPDGEYVSILGGWYEGNRAVVFCQMNNEKDYPNSSLSIVLRGYFIESLIQRGYLDLVFWAGIGKPLLRHSYFIPTSVIHLDRTRLDWRVIRRLVKNFKWLLPTRLNILSDWIVPTIRNEAREMHD